MFPGIPLERRNRGNMPVRFRLQTSSEANHLQEDDESNEMYSVLKIAENLSTCQIRHSENKNVM